ncbi:hypothetical protein METBIDRAFT_10061 [Metschnikowia bicuspidata var. bicuspidata NRRL YB-4993]|uniref:Uncharacterized protein n=1 Tax=Metschnikowia bicuspidata var. bicuspidata NRRL YB-4993 TaxID=869754 RepID=A0A1A0HIL5_9ASCO|nr:hypothetical protein METBIDRAFT_10061 [Metschnikowia bicuspidata var. bicuspidata NRRL YB-4993]OBA23846.1 hypothetical protein METBIDRAFT_10061 [Metschnikowia bicuspidata var. bicuspidata NRRL YB-4993]
MTWPVRLVWRRLSLPGPWPQLVFEGPAKFRFNGQYSVQRGGARARSQKMDSSPPMGCFVGPSSQSAVAPAWVQNYVMASPPLCSSELGNTAIRPRRPQLGSGLGRFIGAVPPGVSAGNSDISFHCRSEYYSCVATQEAPAKATQRPAHMPKKPGQYTHETPTTQDRLHRQRKATRHAAPLLWGRFPPRYKAPVWTLLALVGALLRGHTRLRRPVYGAARHTQTHNKTAPNSRGRLAEKAQEKGRSPIGARPAAAG